MAKDPSYDSDLQMFKQPAKALDWSRLCFLRALAENNRLEHSIAGDPSGAALEGRTADDVRVLTRARLGIAIYAVPEVAGLAGLD